MRFRRQVGPAAVVGAALCAVAQGAAGAPADGNPKRVADKRIAVKDNFFSPRSVTIERGDVVKWVWRGDNKHNVTFTKVPAGASKRSSRSKRRGHWRRSFGKPGLYKYVCTLFSGMRGSITVKPPSESGSTSGAAPPSSPSSPQSVGRVAGEPR
jgi:plastocyanin